MWLPALAGRPGRRALPPEGGSHTESRHLTGWNVAADQPVSEQVGRVFLDARVGVADGVERLQILGNREVRGVIPAKQGERLSLLQIVPQALEELRAAEITFLC